ncbi:LysR family transcriptional regulator [Bradyrhizobium sp. 41S5]|uniref:LysR family transcriptional regulator n=1 Tax=Bradyrhizobium sp. 41S5 TaxID=1404443 RepID=UPI00156B61D5|nr:LysR family transcriptional regulator [Bradyrhizobium sp. 41S5]UFX44141.1 LysR family transcriptional regulator [Bradyrhizobium sp. 41S5]
MDLRQLRYFTVLAEELHFGRAAKRLALSQPPLSHAIQQLEAELGAALFERTSRHVSLTPAGAALQEEARAILQRTHDTRAHVQAIAAGKRGRLRIGFAGSMLYRSLPEILKAFRTTNPNIEIALSEMNSAEQIHALGRDEIDFGFIHSRGPPTDLASLLFLSEPFVACIPADHPRMASRLTLHKLRHQDFVLFSREVSPDYYSSIVALCAEAGFLPRITYEVRHWLGVVSLVAHGMGVALVPRSLADCGLTGAVFKPIGSSTILSESWCVWRNSSRESILLSALVETIRSLKPRLR